MPTGDVKSPGAQVTDMLLERPERRRFDIALARKAAIPVFPPTSTYETVGQVIPGPQLPLHLRSLIPAGRTVGSGILYARETAYDDSVSHPVAPGDLKPQGNLAYEIVLQPVITIPAYMKLPAQYWDDYAMFQSWIDIRLLYGLSVAEEYQLLNGNGATPNLEGLMQVAPVVPTVTPAPIGGAALLANVAAGIASVYSRGYLVTGIVLNPYDWALTQSAHDANGDFLLGPPALITDGLNLWGIPVVISKAMASGNYLVGQFNPYCQIFDRDDAAVEVADQNEDDFVRNLVSVRAEERLAFAIYQPGAFGKGTFTIGDGDGGGVPSVTAITPSSGQQGASLSSVAITGAYTHFTTASLVTFDNPGVTASAITLTDATHLTAALTIAAGAATGDTNVTVTTGSEVATGSLFTVTAGTPSITTITPSSGAQDETLPNVAITGVFTQFATPSLVSFSNPGVTASDITLTDATHLTATVTIDAEAATGASDVTVTTLGEMVTGSGLFTVTAAAARARKK
jgi:Phage capsid family